ncbi:MAG: hypothetical protein VKJ27_06005 [Synechocystis sp.]|nr:hypothetical protein [Synechocystis sp.]
MTNNFEPQSPSPLATDKEIAILRNRLQDATFETNRLRDELEKIEARHQRELETVKRGIETLTSRLEVSQTLHQNLNNEITELQTKLLAMESSKFWRLRHYWFRIKRKFGLSR